MTPFVWTLPETLALAKDCGPNIGVILDVWHWHHSGGTIGDILAADTSRIVHIHVSDAKETPVADVRDNQRLMPGEGIIDLVGFFQALKKIGYADGVSPEPLGRIPAEMTPEEAARLALQTTVTVMKRAGVGRRRNDEHHTRPQLDLQSCAAGCRSNSAGTRHSAAGHAAAGRACAWPWGWPRRTSRGVAPDRERWPRDLQDPRASGHQRDGRRDIGGSWCRLHRLKHSCRTRPTGAPGGGRGGPPVVVMSKG